MLCSVILFERFFYLKASLHTFVDAAESQVTQSEDRGNKLKQLLAKTKKELADAKKTVRPRFCKYMQIAMLAFYHCM